MRVARGTGCKTSILTVALKTLWNWFALEEGGSWLERRYSEHRVNHTVLEAKLQGWRSQALHSLTLPTNVYIHKWKGQHEELTLPLLSTPQNTNGPLLFDDEVNRAAGVSSSLTTLLKSILRPKVFSAELGKSDENCVFVKKTSLLFFCFVSRLYLVLSEQTLY